MQAEPTKTRLLQAASVLFAERGYQGTTARDIATRAGVNLASANYHYGSKKALYLAVLRAQFAEIRTLLAARGGSKPAAELRRLSRHQLEELLRTRARTMLDLLIGPPPGLHGTLMQREMTDPSEALPVIIDEFVLPMSMEMEAIVARLAPGRRGAAVRRCVYSIMGQVLFYRSCMPAVLGMLHTHAYPRNWSQQLSEHICEFSLGGLDRVGQRRPKLGTRRATHAT